MYSVGSRLIFLILKNTISFWLMRQFMKTSYTAVLAYFTKSTLTQHGAVTINRISL